MPFPAGGSTGALARILLEPLQKELGQTVIIENIGGAGGSIGVGRVARAAPDGYTHQPQPHADAMCSTAPC